MPTPTIATRTEPIRLLLLAGGLGGGFGGGGVGRDITFNHPLTMILAGPTSSGKTTWIKKLLESDLIQPTPQRIVWLYKRWQPLYDTMKGIEFHRGIPDDLDDDDFFDVSINNLVVLDDLQSSSSKDDKITDLFTEGSHHRNLSVISLQQTLYPPGNKSCTQRRNALYTVLFKSPQDKRQIMCLAQQMYPHKYHSFMHVYDRATERPHGYLVIDATQTTPEHERLKTNIFNESVITESLQPTPSEQVDHQAQGHAPQSDAPIENTLQDKSKQQDLIRTFAWLTSSDQHKDPPATWKSHISEYVGNDKSDVINPFAIAHIAVQEFKASNEQAPHFFKCLVCKRRNTPGFYMHKCPKCNRVDMYGRSKCGLQIASCPDCHHIFQIGKNDIYEIFFCCNCQEAGITSLKPKRLWDIDLTDWRNKI